MNIRLQVRLHLIDIQER